MKNATISEPNKSNLIFVISLICMFLFLYTGYAKLADHHRFMTGIKNIPMFYDTAIYISWAVPIAEIIIALLLIFPATARPALYGFTFFMVVFTVYILSMMIWAKHLPCHCGGAVEKLSWTQHVFFNLAFIAMAVYALWLGRKQKFKN